MKFVYFLWVGSDVCYGRAPEREDLLILFAREGDVERYPMIESVKSFYRRGDSSIENPARLLSFPISLKDIFFNFNCSLFGEEEKYRGLYLSRLWDEERIFQEMKIVPRFSVAKALLRELRNLIPMPDNYFVDGRK